MTARILAVDDENDVLLVIKTALQSEGFEVETARNGAEALEKVEANTPDLVLLDVMMPEMSGFEVLAAMRKNESLAKIPVIMLTGVSERSKIQGAIDAGADYYIVKPFDFHELLDKVNSALSAPPEFTV